MWKRIALIVVAKLVLLVCLTTACSQGAATETPASTPAAATATDTPSTPTQLPLLPAETVTSPPPTDVLPTKTTVLPTELPFNPTPDQPTVSPTIALQQVIASLPADVVGVWQSQKGLQIILTQSGGIRIRDSETGEEMVGVGAFRVENQQLVLDSDVCLKFELGFAIEYSCEATYMAYLVKVEDEVIGLRFEVVEDPYRDRRNAMTGRDWLRLEE